MKIAKVHLVDHPLFGTMDLNFTGFDRKTLDTIVIAGVNGTGKTTCLEAILKILTDENNDFMDSSLELDIYNLPEYENYEKKLLQIFHKDVNVKYRIWEDKFKEIDEKNRPRIFYMPTEINFEELRGRSLSFSAPYNFVNIVDQKTIDDVPSFIASLINSEVYKNPDLPAKDAIDKVCSEINALFNALEIDAKIVGLNPEGEKLPLFKNSMKQRNSMESTNSWKNCWAAKMKTCC